MQYKTIIHEMLQQRPQMREQLRQERKLLPTMELYATELKANHQVWMDMLLKMRPNSAQRQIESEALEIALKEMEDRLSADPSQPESQPQVLDAAMLFLRRHTRA